jgi:hypothetical protein
VCSNTIPYHRLLHGSNFSGDKNYSPLKGAVEPVSGRMHRQYSPNEMNLAQLKQQAREAWVVAQSVGCGA